MRSRLAWLLGGLALVGALILRRRARTTAAPEPDARAEELRRRLDESRSLAAEREEFEAAETPVDRAELVGETVEERRRRVHEQAQAAAEEMRRE